MAGPMDALSKEALGEAGLLIQTRRGNSCTLAPGAPLGPSPLTPQTEPKTRPEQLTGRTTASPEGLAHTSHVYTPMTSGRRHAAEPENRHAHPKQPRCLERLLASMGARQIIRSKNQGNWRQTGLQASCA